MASSTPLGPRHATNVIQVTNASTSVLADVEIGLVESWSHSPITNLGSLAVGASSLRVPVTREIPLPGSEIAPAVNLIGTAIQEGWYASYTHDGPNRVLESVVVAFGEPEKNVRVTVSNESVSVAFDWVGFGGTMPY